MEEVEMKRSSTEGVKSVRNEAEQLPLKASESGWNTTGGVQSQMSSDGLKNGQLGVPQLWLVMNIFWYDEKMSSHSWRRREDELRLLLNPPEAELIKHLQTEQQRS